MAQPVSRRTVVCVILALLGGLFLVPEVQAIKRRDSAEANDHPEAVLISARDSKKDKAASASGVLIAANAVLTAGHAVDEFDSWEITAPYAKDGPVTAKSTTARLHPGYKHGNFENDLAVLLLDSDIAIGQPFPTLHRGDLLPINTPLLVIGRTDNGTVSSSKLFYASVTLVSFPRNTNLYGGNPAVTEGGDSGGPVYANAKEPRLAGIVSGAAGFSRANVPTDCYVPISSKNRAWILQQLEK
jgi:secreted trypsin-like serine protease